MACVVGVVVGRCKQSLFANACVIVDIVIGASMITTLMCVCVTVCEFASDENGNFGMDGNSL